MKKKVLIVTSPLRVGGFDVVATSLQTHLDCERFECTYYIVGKELVGLIFVFGLYIGFP